MRFLLSRRWILFAVAVALAAWGATLLGQWQFHRLDDRRHENTVVARNLAAPPAPIDEVMSTSMATSPDDEWRRVTVHGEWDDAHTIVLKYQTRDGGPGVDAVTPLVTADGHAVLVDRGWMATDNSGGDRPTIQVGDVEHFRGRRRMRIGRRLAYALEYFAKHNSSRNASYAPYKVGSTVESNVRALMPQVIDTCRVVCHATIFGNWATTSRRCAAK